MDSILFRANGSSGAPTTTASMNYPPPLPYPNNIPETGSGLDSTGSYQTQGQQVNDSGYGHSER